LGYDGRGPEGGGFSSKFVSQQQERRGGERRGEERRGGSEVR
jgi:hypothetical protein